MESIKRILKNQPLETYLLIGLPVLWVLISGLLEKPVFASVLGTTAQSIALNFFFGSYVFIFGTIFIYCYICFKLVMWIGNWVFAKLFKEEPERTFCAKSFFMSILYLMLAIGIGNLTIGLIAGQLSRRASPIQMIAASQLFAGWDRSLFGFDPVLSIHTWLTGPVFDFLLTQSYQEIFAFFGIVLLGLLIFKKQPFRKFIIAFFLAPIVAIPLWYALPAVTPNEMYRENIFSLQSAQTTQQQYMQANVSKNLDSYLGFLNTSVENPTQAHPLVTTNPSMHVAWGFIITYFAIVLWWPLAFIFVPWLVLNMLGTLYTFQHYAVDLPTGIAVGILAIIITHYLFVWEKKYYTGDYPRLHFIDEVQTDAQKLIQIIKKLPISRS